jgi:predicted phage terminase large subunit-like protein
MKLVDVAMGRCPRLVVTMPPQNGKSSLVSHWFPVWYLDRFSDRRIILVSYAAEYAEEWGRQVRNSIEDHADSLSVRLAPDSSAADRWATTLDGGMVSTGIGGRVTGRRANVLIFDDPLKNAEEANSQNHRNKVWEFFKSAGYTRLTPDGAIIVVMTRWHEDDLVGRIDKEQEAGGERWERVDLPAIAGRDDPLGRDDGAALWPERWPLSALERIRTALGTYRWGALYQQHPTTPEGNYFKRAWFKVIESDRVPAMQKVTRCWDLAATAEGEAGNDDPDWFAGCKMGRGIDGDYYILHAMKERVSPQGVESILKLQGQVDGKDVAIRIEQEGAASGKIVKYHFQRMMDGWDCRFTGIPRSSKFTRSGPFNAACERGQVKLVKGTWNQEWIDELSAFPQGTHDDQVDAAVCAYESLNNGIRQWGTDELGTVFDRRQHVTRKSAYEELMDKLKVNRSN